MLTGKTNEEKIWNYLVGKGLSAEGAAGLMGNLYAESGLNPQNLQNTYEKKLGYTDATYTAAVDSGKYQNFVHDSAGYGLAQWTYWSRKEALLDYAKSHGKSVGDLETQLGYLMQELEHDYKAVLSTLKSTGSVKAASNVVLLKFERPADQGVAVQNARAKIGQAYYDKYAAKAAQEGEMSMTEQQLRKKYVDYAITYLGCKESDGSHKKIIDLYNSHKPLAQGYKMKYTDAWCACYVSAMAIGCGLEDIIPLEVSCGRYITLAKNMGIWVESDRYTPKMGDLILYDWDDTGSGDATTGADHIGIVVSVTGKTIKVIEGNNGDAVAYRTIQVNGRYIRGFVTPKYASAAGETSSTSGSSGSSGSAASSSDASLEYKVGDTVQFSGGKHYAASNASSGTTVKAGPAKITALAKGAKHPYHVIHTDSTSTVYGWVDATAISGAGSGSTGLTYTVQAGDSLWAIAQKQLGNGSRWQEIAQLNGLTSTTIQIGQVLKLPD